ncbi:stage III sporulation protein AF [Romboutsia sp.]|uniref:stage III sporulation protein AF n=1 Tax=Romboutsia sp. TaxID=1965302 RepID=UPI003F2E9EB3
MLNDIKMWIVTILIGAFIVNIVDMLLPESKIKPYINVVLNFIFVFIVLTPIIGFFSKDMSLEDRLLKYMGEYNKEYVNSVNNLASKTGNSNLSKGYEDGLKEVLKLKLQDYGYELEDIQFDGSKIENIKLKENNSNKDLNEDIQYNKNEKSQQVFRDKDKEKNANQELDLKEDKIKEELVKILDVSIETIQID